MGRGSVTPGKSEEYLLATWMEVIWSTLLLSHLLLQTTAVSFHMCKKKKYAASSVSRIYVKRICRLEQAAGSEFIHTRQSIRFSKNKIITSPPRPVKAYAPHSNIVMFLVHLDRKSGRYPALQNCMGINGRWISLQMTYYSGCLKCFEMIKSHNSK